METTLICCAMLCSAMLCSPGSFSFLALLRRPPQCQKSDPNKGSTWAAWPLFALRKKLRFFLYQIPVTPAQDA